MPKASRAASVVLFCAVLLSMAVSPWPRESAIKAAPLLLGLGLYLAIARLAPVMLVHGPIRSGLILTSVGISLIALLARVNTPQAGAGSALAQLGHALAGRFNTNVVAGALVVLWPFGVARGIVRSHRNAGEWLMSAWAWAASALSLSAIAISGSSASAVSSACGAMALAVVFWPHLSHPTRAGLGIAVVLAILPQGWALISAYRDPGTALATLHQRAEIWSRAVMIIRDFSFTGIGFGNFQSFVLKLMPLLASRRQTVSHAHNLYLQVAVDLGLPGMGGFLVVIATSLRSALRIARPDRSLPQPRASFLAGACLASLIGMCIHGLVDASIWGNKGAFLPWIVMGVSAALDRESSVLSAAKHIGDQAYDH